MNNKGQVLILFLILMPIILLLIGSCIELGSLYINKLHFEKVTKSIIINDIEEKEKNDIINIYTSNDIKIESLDINYGDEVNIKASAKVKSILGKLINKDYYVIKVDITGAK